MASNWQGKPFPICVSLHIVNIYIYIHITIYINIYHYNNWHINLFHWNQCLKINISFKQWNYELVSSKWKFDKKCQARHIQRNGFVFLSTFNGIFCVYWKKHKIYVNTGVSFNKNNKLIFNYEILFLADIFYKTLISMKQVHTSIV